MDADEYEDYSRELEQEMLDLKEEIQKMLEAALSEINYALHSHKSKEVKDFYLQNAIRFILTAKENMKK